MSVESSEAAADPRGQRTSQVRGAVKPQSSLVFALVALAAFGLYWASSYRLNEREGTKHFAADTWFYTTLAQGNVFDRMADEPDLARIFRFHPTTVVMAAAWMQILSPLTRWFEPLYLLKAMFAAVGAVGVWAAMWGFAAVVPRGQAILWGLIYASSLGIWYFSSIEESKIVTATLSSLYIAAYLHLRNRWMTGSAVLLTAILLLACLNEIVAGFLVIIPVVDTLVRRGREFRHSSWIAWHALAGPVALAILEGIGRGWTAAAGSHPEGATHFSMLLWYISQNYFTLESLYAFAVRWLFINIAAPEPRADHWADPSINYGGDFKPELENYFSSPVSVSLVVMFALILVVAVWWRQRSERADNLAGILPALLAYALLRSTFFFIFNSKECLLFSSSVTLAHLLMVGIPFVASNFPPKRTALLVFAILLLMVNGAFIAGDPRLLVYHWGEITAAH